MIKRLQKRFVFITMTALFFILLVFLFSTLFFNYFQMTNRADHFLELLVTNQGQLKEEMLEANPMEDSFFNPGESPYELRYFSINYENGIAADTEFIDSITDDVIQDLARRTIGQEETNGTIDNFRYLKVEEESVVYFINIYEQQQSLERFFLNSALVYFVILVVFFIVVNRFSQEAIKPTVESILKQRRFITDAGHEIKTPLSIISANCEVLEMQYGRNEWLDSTQNQVRRLNFLVKNLLTLSKMDEEQVEITFVSVNFTKLVEETIDPFMVLAKKKEILFEKSLEEDVVLNGDPGRLGQLVSILTDNSIKYTPDQGKIQVHLEEKGKNAILRITNTVDKLPEGDLNQLFDRFYRPDDARCSVTGGYGIGLSLARVIVRNHGGKITAMEDRYGKNIIFQVELPRRS